MNVARSVELGRREFPERPALRFEGESINYARLDALACAEALRLRAEGLERGDRVALCLPNTPQFVASYLGALKIGCIVVSINPTLTRDEIDFMLADSGAKQVIRDADAWRNAPLHVDEVPAREMTADDPAVIVYTSGTTGFPKGATLSHGNVSFVMEAKRRYLGIHPEDRLSLFLPLFHCFGQNAILNAGLCAGATLVMQRGFDAERVLETIERERVTMVCAVPANFVVLCEAATPERLRSVRYWMSAAAPLPLEVERRWQAKFGQPIYQGYGLTETSPFASYNHATAHRQGSIGTPIEGVEMGVVDVDGGHMLAPGDAGEIVVRGPNVMLGYWNRPQETSEAIRDGWFHTGDIGRMDSDGYFHIEDRLKDMVIVGGYNVYPAEVENALYRHPAVAEAAAYGVPDALLGERVRAAIVLKPGVSITEAELIASCRTSLAEYKLPTAIDFVDALPKCRAGKIRKRVLRASYCASSERHAGAVTDAAELERRIVAWAADRLARAPGEIRIDRPFAELGFSSLAIVELSAWLSGVLGRTVSPTLPWNYSTPRSLARHFLPEPERANGHVALSDVARLSDEEAERALLAELETRSGMPL